MTTVPDLLQHYEATCKLVAVEEDRPPVAHYEDWQACHQHRAALTEQLIRLEQVVASLRRRVAALPTLAQPAQVHWAQALLSFPNLAFLEVDTDGLGADADNLRIALLDQAGVVLYDQLVQPRRPLSPKIAHLTGITPDARAGSASF